MIYYANQVTRAPAHGVPDLQLTQLFLHSVLSSVPQYGKAVSVDATSIERHKALLLTLVVIGANYAITIVFLRTAYSGLAGQIIFNGVRALVYLFLGWLVISHYKKGLLTATLAAICIFFYDHVIIKAVHYSIVYWRGERVSQEDFISAIVLVISSYLFFVPVIILLSLLGGYLAKRKRNKQNPGQNYL